MVYDYDLIEIMIYFKLKLLEKDTEKKILHYYIPEGPEKNLDLILMTYHLDNFGIIKRENTVFNL